MKKCELCNISVARIVCISDKARLCWECDFRVHSANFLVAKHSRILLCHSCHSITPWNCSGKKLPVTVTVCESCAGDTCSVNDEHVVEGYISEDEVGSGNGELDDETDESDPQYQVVPLSPMDSSS